jgi:hypothetical protein
MRYDWEMIKDAIMLKCLFVKFCQNEDLAMKLIKTENIELEEGNNWHDNYWGACQCEYCLTTTVGINMLGQILMKVRKELKYGRD